MTVLPWRLRAFISNRWPLAYHIVANFATKRRSQSYWDARLAESWEQRNWPGKNVLIARLTHPDDRILDIACGNGGILRHLKSCGYRNLEGLEISKYAIERLRAEGLTMHHGNVPTLSLPDAAYDVVIASQVLEHIIRRQHFAREIARVLRPQGIGFFFVPNDCLGPIDEPEHVAKYTATTLQKFLSKHFEVLSIEVIKDPNYPMTILFGQVRNREQHCMRLGNGCRVPSS
jgi:Methylase involved in ubiquinone/menaquinone biosynthesis